MRKRMTSVFLMLCIALLLPPALVVESEAFTDVNPNDWYASGVSYVYTNGLMNGVSDTEFQPQGITTRGMLVTILWRLAGSPDASNQSYSDVASNQYYSTAIAWATECNIVGGYGNGCFGPNDKITREQMVTILYRYATYQGSELLERKDLSSYTDIDQLSEYAKDSMSWACAVGLVNGTTETTLSAKGDATRSQVAVILNRFCDNIIADSEDVDDESETPIEAQDSEKNPAEEGSDIVDIPSTPLITENKTVISIEDVTVTPGETTVSVPVSIENNPGVLGMMLTISYDESMLSMTSATSGQAIKNALTFMPSKSLESGCHFVWYAAEISDEDIKDGEVLMLQFDILNGATSGEYEIELSYVPEDIIDNELNEVPISTSNGYVSIE